MERQTSEMRYESIFHKVVSSGLWIFTGNTLNRVLGFIRTVILARLLSPADFGLFGIAMLVMGALDRLTQTGIEEAIIQRRNAIDEYINVAWTINIIRSLVIFALLYFLAPYAAHFFRDERVVPVIKTISLILLLNALYNIGIVHLKKSLSFNKLFIYRFSGNLADFLVAISVALFLRNVWALVIGYVFSIFNLIFPSSI